MKIRELLKLTPEQLFEKGYDRVKIRYIDKSVRIFNIYEFDIHKEKIIKNLLNKNKCRIIFLKKNKFKNMFTSKKIFALLAGNQR